VAFIWAQKDYTWEGSAVSLLVALKEAHPEALLPETPELFMQVLPTIRPHVEPAGFTIAISEESPEAYIHLHQGNNND
jgi:hypothetical protein